MADSQAEIRESVLDNEEMRKIFVAGIPADVTDEVLKTLFEEVGSGTVTECEIVRKEGKKNHFGFVTFETSELVDECLLNKTSLKIGEKELDVNRAVPKSSTWVGAHEKTKKLFIANLSKTATEEELKEYFEKRHPKKYGTVDSIQLIKNKNPDGSRTEENKGYGFVFVSSEDMADKMSIQHTTFQFGGRKIELKKSVPTGGKEGGRGRGRGARGGEMGAMRGGRGGAFGQGYGQGYDPSYGQAYGQGFDNQGFGEGYGQGYGGGYGGYGGFDPYAGYGAGYDQYGYGGGYGAQQQQRGRGRGRGGNRFAPY